MQRIGILGGTFDPPHIGHLQLGRVACEQLSLDKVLFMPAGEPPHKRHKAVTSVQHRLQMLALALSEEPCFTLDTTDLTRPGPHYTATLLPLVQAMYPTATLWLIMGADSLRDLPKWYAPARILQLARLAVLARPGVTLDWVVLEGYHAEIRSRVDFLHGEAVAISSTAVRENVAQAHEVPPAVWAYILQHGLYGFQTIKDTR